MAQADQTTLPNSQAPSQPMNEPHAPTQAIQPDTVMTDVVPNSIPNAGATPSTVQSTQSGPTPQPARSTPARATPTPAPAPEPFPSKAKPHGAPARQYLNEKVTGVLLQGMKRLASEKPEDPLRVLGEFLLAKSKELETPRGPGT